MSYGSNGMRNDMDKKCIDQIRQIFWNYKYQKDYNEEIYQSAVKLISHFDAEEERQSRIREWTVVWFVVLFFMSFVGFILFT